MNQIRSKLTDYDVNLSYKLFNCVPRNNANARLALKSLEWSCHGVPFIALTIICLYLSPKSEFLANLFTGLVVDIIYVAIAKASSRRRRPNYAVQDQIVIAMDKHSFPSGHVSRAIYVALIFSRYYSLWVTWFIWIWAIMVTFSRVLLGRHFIGDVIAGFLLGLINYQLQFSFLSFLYNGIYYLLNTVLATQFRNQFDMTDDTAIDIDFVNDDF